MAEAIPITHLPLSHDVLRSFRVLVAIPSTEPIPHPLEPSRTVARMPDGRYVLCEMSGDVGAVVGKPVQLNEAIDLAKSLLAADLPPSPAATGLRTIAVALLGLLHDPMRNVVALPAARGAS